MGYTFRVSGFKGVFMVFPDPKVDIRPGKV